MDRVEVEVVGVGALGVPERDAWRAFVAADPALRHPYFDLRYAEAAAASAPGAAVAVLRRAGRLVGFLPFQRRGGAVQPLGAPLSDYHGLILAPGERVDLEAVITALGARVYRFNGMTAQEPSAQWSSRRRMVADLSEGWDAWLAARLAMKPRVFKRLRQSERALVRDLGPITFTLEERDPAVLDHILRRKREQMDRTGWPDIFACGWTEALLHRLLAEPSDDFGCSLAVLRAGGRMVSAELGLHGASVRHLWFPIYEPELSRYAPGMLMTLKTIEACAAAGITRVDFGPGGEDYKTAFAEPAEEVFEGVVTAQPWRSAASRLMDAAVSADPVRLGRLRTSVKRRLDVATACEPTLTRRLSILTRLRLVAARSAAFVFALPIGL